MKTSVYERFPHPKPVTMSPLLHPLQMLTVEETAKARDAVLAAHPGNVIEFRQIDLREPNKKELLDFLQLEHDNKVSAMTTRPARIAKCHYDIISADRTINYNESLVDVQTGKMVENMVVGKEFSPSLTLQEFSRKEVMQKLTWSIAGSLIP